MKTHLLTLLILAAAVSVKADRTITPLGDDWKFIRQDAGIDADSSSWENVTVPHCWNALDGQVGPAVLSDRLETESEAKASADAWKSHPPATNDPHFPGGYYRGACWYEHPLEIPADWKGTKRVFVRFGAAGTVARVYFNKVMLGEHRGGFTAFCVELPPSLISYGGRNELRVQVDNTHREDLPPLSGDFNVAGGLYRNIEMIVTGPTCISPLDYASPGVYVTPRRIEPKSASVGVTTILSDVMPPKKVASKAGTHPLPEEKPPVLELKTEILTPDGKFVASAATNPILTPGQTLPVSQSLTIPSPRLWKGRNDPYLYTVAVTLLRDGKPADKIEQPLGLRTVSITQDRGFLLNGQPYPVHGVNRHQELRGKGWALSPQDEERDANIIREMGATAIRNTHYPQGENWHRLHDREGILLWDEVTLVDRTSGSREFWRNTEEYLREMIHQLHNHPSIVWWGIFNELENKEMPPSEEWLTRLRQVAKELDPDRIVVAATCHTGRPFNKIPEQICLNTYPGWYSNTTNGASSKQTMEQRITAFSKEVGKRIGVSEYGAGANISHHTEGDPVKPVHNGPFHPEEWQSFIHEGDWAAMKDNPKLWGTFVWCMFDFACKSRNEGNTPALNDKGLVTHDRQFRKDAYYFYKANWNPEPMIRITSSRLTPRRQAVTGVKIYSNCPEVSLSVNGKAIGKARPDSLKICYFPGVKLEPYNNHIEAYAEVDGKKVSDSCTWVLTPSGDPSPSTSPLPTPAP
jgi:beta-galactosidase